MPEWSNTDLRKSQSQTGNNQCLSVKCSFTLERKITKNDFFYTQEQIKPFLSKNTLISGNIFGKIKHFGND